LREKLSYSLPVCKNIIGRPVRITGLVDLLWKIAVKLQYLRDSEMLVQIFASGAVFFRKIETKTK